MIFGALFGCTKCCGKSEHEILFEKGVARFTKESNIIRIARSIRYFRHALTESNILDDDIRNKAIDKYHLNVEKDSDSSSCESDKSG